MDREPTTDPLTALQRLAEHLGGVTLEQEEDGPIWFLEYAGVSYVGPLERCLARLVQIAQETAGLSREQIAEVIRLTKIEPEGLTKHMHQTIEEATLPAVRPTHTNGGGPD